MGAVGNRAYQIFGQCDLKSRLPDFYGRGFKPRLPDFWAVWLETAPMGFLRVWQNAFYRDFYLF